MNKRKEIEEYIIEGDCPSYVNRARFQMESVKITEFIKKHSDIDTNKTKNPVDQIRLFADTYLWKGAGNISRLSQWRGAEVALSFGLYYKNKVEQLEFTF